MINRYGKEVSWNPKTYNPIIHGAVTAIRLFHDEKGYEILAELAFAYGGTTIIEWTRPDIRNRFSAGITGYTLMFDERITDSDHQLSEVANFGRMVIEESILKIDINNLPINYMRMICIKNKYNDAYDREETIQKHGSYHHGDCIGDQIILDKNTIYVSSDGYAIGSGYVVKDGTIYNCGMSTYPLNRFRTMDEGEE